MMINKEVMMINKEMSVAEAKKHFSDLLGRVAYGGERVTILKMGKTNAVMVPPTQVPGEEHVSKIEGWLEPDDPFFKAIDQIVCDRADHLPRVSKSSRD
jgi:prevent-host-death family protein